MVPQVWSRGLETTEKRNLLQKHHFGLLPYSIVPPWQNYYWTIAFSTISECLAKKNFVNLFYYSVYFCYYLWALLHFLILFINLTVLFQLTFTVIIFSFRKISEFQIDTIHTKKRKRKKIIFFQILSMAHIRFFKFKSVQITMSI